MPAANYFLMFSGFLPIYKRVQKTRLSPAGFLNSF